MSRRQREEQHWTRSKARRSRMAALFGAAAAVALCLACGGSAGADDPAAAGPWGANTVSPADLVKELAAATGDARPVVICTGPPGLFRSGHVPGAVFHGPAGSAAGLNDLMTWAGTLPKTASLVVYCGCCPVADCPNIRPAYTALKEMGFAKVRVLWLPTNFGTDWAAKGYAVEK